MILAQVAIIDAKNMVVTNPKMQKIVAYQIAQTKKEFNQGMDAATAGRSAIAVTRFGHSWLHAQLAMKFANLKIPSSLPEGGGKGKK
jgi:hypothetical protein